MYIHSEPDQWTVREDGLSKKFNTYDSDQRDPEQIVTFIDLWALLSYNNGGK